MQQQVHNKRLATLSAFNVEEGSEPKTICNPDAMEKFFMENGAPTLFKSLIKMMTPLRQDKRKVESMKADKTRKHAVVIVYLLAYSQSQMCNWL